MENLRTRSQAAPDWSNQELLILVNELTAVERDCLNAFASFQKWKIVVDNCNSLGLNRSLNQCKKKWNSLLDDYKKSKIFDADLFKAIDDYVRVRDSRSDTDPDSDPNDEADPDDLLLNVIANSVSLRSKKRKRKIMPRKHFLEDWGARRKSSKSVKKTNKLCRPDPEVKVEVQCPKESIDVKSKNEDGSQEELVERMTAELLKTAEHINTVLGGEFLEKVDYRLADLESAKAAQTFTARRQGDELISCLGNYTHTLDQLCQILKTE